jgi:hypothetical protein
MQCCSPRFYLHTVENNNTLLSYGGKLPNVEKCRLIRTKADADHLTETDAESVGYQSNVYSFNI